MIFEKIILNNMFSYYGEVVFELAGRTDQKNIVLISGRNGFGKTSFLNAIRLLFTGVTNELRMEIQRHRKPSVKQYVIGTGDDWWGILNRHAKADSTHCSVEVEWREKNGQVSVRREWNVQHDSYYEQLTVHLAGKVLENDEAQSFLDERIPEEYVPFFFFDGEKIQELASANIAETAEHIERLLNISHVNNLRDALKDAITDWRREGALDQAAEAELEKVKNEYRIVAKKIQAEAQRKKEIEYDIEQLDEDIARLQERQESSRSFISQQDEAAVQRRIKELRQEQEELLNDIGEELPYDIVLLANEKLLREVQNELDMLLPNNIVQNNSLAQQLLEFLPDDIFERPPLPVFPLVPLSEEQKDFYKKKLIRKLKEYSEDHESPASSSLFSLNIAEADSLQECIQSYLDSRLLRMERKKTFDHLQTVKRKLGQLESELLNISSLSVEEKQNYEQLKITLEEKRREHDNFMYQLGKVNNNGVKLVKEYEGLKTEIKKKERKLQLTKVTRRKIDKAREIQGFFNEYKDRLKKQRKDELEKFINKYFKQIMTSNELIEHIVIDEKFGVHYQDKDGIAVGMASLSAGMKQLSATSLLWALKTCSDRPLPIIVDTPMARIDKGNQENLLRHYYPVVSEQVILLPTDSELDKEKYNILKPYIYQEYVLENKTGSKTQPVKRSMYSS